MKLYKTIFIVFFILTGFKCLSQKGYGDKTPCYLGDTLVDKQLKMKLFLDSTQKKLIAVDFNNKMVWQSSPWAFQSFISYDSSINDSFRSNRLTAFFLDTRKRKGDLYIYLRFFNSPIAAIIKRKTGEFHLIGVM